MSPDEVFVTVAAAILGLMGWANWSYRLAGVKRLRGSGASAPVIAGVVGSGALLAFVLVTASASDVRTAPVYIVMYLVIGLAWLRLADWAFRWGGLSVRDDVGERGNWAASVAMAGAFLGVACCYAGGNIGEGPGWPVVIFSGLLATSVLAIVWAIVTMSTNVIDVITIDRDLAAGVRFAGLLTACGLILGRAVAGNWLSMQDTLHDFVAPALAVVPLVAIAVVVERVLAPTPAAPTAPVLRSGLIPAAVYLAAAAALLRWLGWPA